MAEYDKATLTIGDGVFEMAGNLTVTESVRTGYLVGGANSNLWSRTAEVLGYETYRKGVFIDNAGGAHTVEIQFEGWEGAQDAAGNPLQWGDTGNTGTLTKTDATGEKAVDQLQVFVYYMRTHEVDSTSPATLEFGQYADDGIYEPLDVVIEGPNLTKTAEDGERFTGTLTCISSLDLDEAVDAVVQTG